MQPKRQLTRKDTPAEEDKEDDSVNKENGRRKKSDRAPTFEQRKAMFKESMALKDASNKPILKAQKSY